MFEPTPVLWPAEPRMGVSVFVEPLRLSDDGRVVPDVAAVGGDWRAQWASLPEDFVFREVRETPLTGDGVVALMSEYGSLVGSEVPQDGYPIEEAIAALEAVRLLADAYLAFARGDEDEFTRIMGVPESYAGAWSAWQASVNEALRAFPMFIEVDPDPAHSWLKSSEAPRHTLYEAAVFQLATVVAEARTFRLCANENCGRPFTRHRSDKRKLGDERAHSAGIKYCSPLCAKAQSERDRRRRRRAEKGA